MHAVHEENALCAKLRIHVQHQYLERENDSNLCIPAQLLML